MVRDEDHGFGIYRHSDGYPYGEHGVLHGIRRAFPYAWGMSRFEAMDFAAALVRAWKDRGGGIYLTTGRDGHDDTDYHYEIGRLKDQAALYVTVWVPLRPALDARSWVKLAAARVTPDRVKMLALSRADAAVAREAGVLTDHADTLQRLGDQDETLELPGAEPARPQPVPLQVDRIGMDGTLDRMVGDLVRGHVHMGREAIVDEVMERLLERLAGVGKGGGE